MPRLPDWMQATVLFVGTTGLFWLGNDSMALWDRDEPRYAETARQMVERNDYLIPYFNDQFRFQKPPMTYWLIIGSYSIFGVTDFATRAVMGLCVAGVAVLCWHLGNRMFGRPAGWIAAAIMVLSPMGVLLGKLALPDAPQLLCATLCLSALYHSWAINHETQFSNAVWSRVFWLALMCSVFIKGPIVLAMLALAMLTLFLMSGINPTQFRVRWIIGSAVTLVILGTWIALIGWATEWAFFRESVGNQIARRMAESFDGRFYPPGYYPVTAIVLLAPWTPFVLLALVTKTGRWQRRTPEALLASWVVGSLILLECFRSKQPHYWAPAYPALALLASSYLAPVLRREIAWPARWLEQTSAIWLAFFGICVGLGLPILGWRWNSTVWWWCSITGGLCGVAFWCSAHAVFRNRVLVALRILPVGIVFMIVAFSLAILPAMDQQRIAKSIGESLARETRIPAFTFGCIEPSMVYYRGEPIIDLADRKEEIARLKAVPGPFRCAVLASRLKEFQDVVTTDFVVEHTWRGWLRMHPDEVLLLRCRSQEATMAARVSDPSKSRPLR